MNYDKNNLLNNITHKEIAKTIKHLSKKNLSICIIILIISAIVAIIASLYLILIEEDPETGFLLFIISLVSIIITFNTCYFSFLILSGYGALIEDVNQIKKTISKDDIDFTDLPRL